MCIREDTLNTTIEKIIDKTPTKDLKILSVKEISKQIGKNDVAVRKNYKRKREIHLSKFIYHKKIQKSYTLLKNNFDLSIKDISNIIGYEKIENFRNAFKKYFGKTPSETRTRCKKK